MKESSSNYYFNICLFKPFTDIHSIATPQSHHAAPTGFRRLPATGRAARSPAGEVEVARVTLGQLCAFQVTWRILLVDLCLINS